MLQAVEAAQLAEDLKVQLEHTQAKLKEIQVSVAENRTARERESSNLKRAQVCCIAICESKSSLSPLSLNSDQNVTGCSNEPSFGVF